MRLFLAELRTRGRASVRALMARHKATIGYVILAAGVLIALIFAFKAVNSSNDRGNRLAGVICQNTIAADRQQVLNLVTKNGQGLLASFHLTENGAAVLIHKSLEATAAERLSLQPSSPAGACTPAITKIPPPPLPPHITWAQKKALAIATAPVPVDKLPPVAIPLPVKK